MKEEKGRGKNKREREEEKRRRKTKIRKRRDEELRRELAGCLKVRQIVTCEGVREHREFVLQRGQERVEPRAAAVAGGLGEGVDIGAAQAGRGRKG